MASSSRFDLDTVVRVCTLSDNELEEAEDEMEVESEEEELETRMSDEAGSTAYFKGLTVKLQPVVLCLLREIHFCLIQTYVILCTAS